MFSIKPIRQVRLAIVSALLLGFQLHSSALAVCIEADSMPDPPTPSTYAEGLKYSDSEEARQAIKQCITSAKKACSHKNSKLKEAIVFDIDETLLDNRPHYRKQCNEGSCTYNPTEFSKWVLRSEAPAIPEVLKFLTRVKHQGYYVFLITGRTEDWRDATITNLNSINAKYDGLCMKKPDDKRNVQLVKSEWRETLTRMGYSIRANLGDQLSDLRGGYSETCQKIPNKMYVIVGPTIQPQSAGFAF